MTGDAEKKPLSALRFASLKPHAVLLGDPGGGKSTFTNMITLCLAAELLGWEGAGLARLGEDWEVGSLLPARIIVREFAVANLEHIDPGKRLWEFFVSTLPSSYREALGRNLKKHFFQDGGIFILDGYDEAPEAERHREMVRASVASLREEFPKARVLLTSRVYAYQRPEWRLDEFGFEEATIAPFTDDQQELFIDKWYNYAARVRPNLSEEEAKGRAAQLKGALREREDLRPLSERPLLLTLMASLHAWRHGSLPEGREGLYEESVKLLMEQWQKPKMMDDDCGLPQLVEQTAAEFLKITPKKVYDALERLAFESHRDQEKREGVADISTERLVGALARETGEDVKPNQIIAYVRDRAGLLNDHGGEVYRFPHRTFQEYLAARWLSQDDFPDQLVGLVRSDPERWREAFLLAGSKAAKGTVSSAWWLVENVLAEGEGSQSDQDWQCRSLCGQLLVETGIHKKELNKKQCKTLGELRHLLANLLDEGHLPAVERSAAGHWLGMLGDSRPGTGLTEDGLPDIEWITVEPPEQGWFWMGEKEKWHGERRFKCDWIKEPYRIARYPVTVAQFQVFLDAQEPSQAPSRIEVSDPNQPRVDVSWDDAVAYCKWLGEQLGMAISLPNEAQWEYAARGVDGREYPWGKGWIGGAANTAESGIGKTSAVGIFPQDESWCGTRDMAGNVWEWCRTKWHDKHRRKLSPEDELLDGSDDPRVLRGGARTDLSDFARCAFRSRDPPGTRISFIGFRLCVSPFSSSEL